MKALCRPLLPFVMPAAVVSATCFLSVKGPVWSPESNFSQELTALTLVLPSLPYVFLGAGLLLAWRFRQTGMVLTTCLLGIVYWAVHQEECAPGSGCLKILASLLAIEIAVFSGWRWRQLPLRTTVSWLGVMLLQTVLVLGASRLLQGGAMRPGSVVNSPLLEHGLAFFSRWDAAPLLRFQPEALLFYIVGFYLLFLSLQKQDVLLTGLLGALLSVFLGLGPIQTAIGPPAAFLSAGLILVLACDEASIIMAYRDDLTGLPSRRALSQTLAGHGSHYAIAMIDVDHFKRFNDIHGHKTGDQILKLLAARLTRMSGGAKAFRYGGEEFTAVFPGKSVEDAFPHLEACRRRLAANPFIVRGNMRSRASAKLRGTNRGGKARKQAKVTASFGVAEPSPSLKTPTQVIAAADKALYRAKRAGRNCVKT